MLHGIQVSKIVVRFNKLLVPYALVGMSVPKEETGLYMGILNTAQVVAQLTTNFIGTSAMSYSKFPGMGLVVGGAFAFVGCFLVFILKVKRPEDEDEIYIK